MKKLPWALIVEAIVFAGVLWAFDADSWALAVLVGHVYWYVLQRRIDRVNQRAVNALLYAEHLMRCMRAARDPIEFAADELADDGGTPRLIAYGVLPGRIESAREELAETLAMEPSEQITAEQLEGAAAYERNRIAEMEQQLAKLRAELGASRPVKHGSS